MEGFTAFRRRTVVDLADAELFALTGPTGAGKSSVLDAMVFALYGSVPRHDRRSVGSVVTQGCIQARVLLEFDVGTATYVAARVVRKDARGRANTDEARLERDGSVVASGAREVDEAVAELLGLDYDQFTTCVVLPQGEFQRFLHAKPSDRQGLLVALLDLGIYEALAQLAGQRQRYEEGRHSGIEAQLGALTEADEETRAAAAARVEELGALVEAIDRVQPELDDLETRGREARMRLDDVAQQRELLRGLRLPDGFAELVDQLDAARRRRASADEQLGLARQASIAAEAAMEGSPGSARIRSLLDRRIRLDDLGERHRQAEQELIEAERAVDSARRRSLQAAGALEEGRRHDMALHLRRGLEAGTPCPVCTRPIDDPPEVGDDAELSGLEAVARDAASALERAGSEATRIRTRLDELAHQIAQSADGIQDEVPDVATLTALLADATAREEQLAGARRQVERATADLAEATRSIEGLADREREARSSLQRARDSVAGLGPPVLEMEDVAGDWKQLVEWAATVHPDLDARMAVLEEECRTLRDAFGELSASLRARAAESGVDPGVGRTRDAVVEARSGAASRLAAIDEQLARSAMLRQELAVVAERAVVARELAGHLRANNFESWMLDEAMRVLAIGANARLAELAQGRYSLALSGRNFDIVDHHAADEVRPVRSLSGGETFLVSLALALSLADHIAEMASGGSARLESIFLDEGFGTLDAETLETVAAVISAIGSSGKTVGIVTHVKELADQAPVRFEVVKDAGGATIARVDS